MSEVSKAGAASLNPGISNLVESIAKDANQTVQLAPRQGEVPNPQFFGNAAQAFAGLPQINQAPENFSPIPLPFAVSDLQLADPIRNIREAFLPAQFQAELIKPASGGNADILGGASQIDALLAEAQGILNDPNATMEDKLIAQQKMSQAMTLFQFLSGLIKQIADMEQTATRNLS